MRNAVIVCLLALANSLCFANFTISGTVKDIEGNPVAYRYVTVQQDDPFYYVSVQTDALGAFTFSNVPAEETVLFMTWWNLPTGQASFRYMVDLNSNIAGLNLQLTPEAVIEGWIIDKDTAEPIGGAAVTGRQSPFYAAATTDASGFFRLSHLPAGSIEVIANAEAYGYAWREHDVILQAEEHREDVLIALRRNRCRRPSRRRR